MTRKDYNLIAAAFRAFNYLDQPTRYFIAQALADRLEKDNERFDRARFIESCDLFHRMPQRPAKLTNPHELIDRPCTDSELLHAITDLFDQPDEGRTRNAIWVDTVEELLLNARTGTTLPARV
jgi:hypothetical protein